MQETTEINGKDCAEDLHNYGNYPLADIVHVVDIVMTRLAENVTKALRYGNDTEFNRLVSLERPIEEITLPIPIPLMFLEILREVESELLANPVSRATCIRCRAEHAKGCPGVLKPGDLIKCLFTGVLNYGFKAIFQICAENVLEETSQPQETPTTAFEVFNPKLRKATLQ